MQSPTNPMMTGYPGAMPQPPSQPPQANSFVDKFKMALSAINDARGAPPQMAPQMPAQPFMAHQMAMPAFHPPMPSSPSPMAPQMGLPPMQRQRFDVGGEVYGPPDPFLSDTSPGQGPGGDAATPTPQGPSMLQKFNSGLQSMNKSLSADQNKKQQGGSPDPGASALAQGQSDLSNRMNMLLSQTNQRQGFADGGDAWLPWDKPDNTPDQTTMPAFAGSSTSEDVPRAVSAQSQSGRPFPAPDYVGATEKTEPSPSSAQPPRGWLDKVTDTIGVGRLANDGIWTYDKNGNRNQPTPMQNLGIALMSVKGGPMEGIGQNLMAQAQNRYKDMEAEQNAAVLMGKFRNNPTLAAQEAVGTVNGQPTIASRNAAIAAAQSPAHIRQMNASAAASEVAADKEYQMRLATVPAMRSEAAIIDNNETYRIYSRDAAENKRQADEARARLQARYQQSNTDASSTPRSGQAATAAPSVAPPVTGARKAADGKYYVPDPNRPGKYFEVRP